MLSVFFCCGTRNQHDLIPCVRGGIGCPFLCEYFFGFRFYPIERVVRRTLPVTVERAHSIVRAPGARESP